MRAAGFATDVRACRELDEGGGCEQGCQTADCPPLFPGVVMHETTDPWVLRRKSHLGALGLRPNFARRHPVSTAHLRQGRTAEANDYGTSTM